MAVAREVLGSGPVEVDIVVARSAVDTLSRKITSRMRESSVDYENVVLRPRQPASEPSTPTDVPAPESFQPKTTSSPLPHRTEVSTIKYQ